MPGFRLKARRFKPSIIGVLLAALLLALGGCSSVRLAYNNGQQLAWWWVDGYADFDSEQAPAVRQAIDRLFVWHRGTQLPDYTALLVSAQAAVLEPTTPAQACTWQDTVRASLEPSLDFLLVQAAELLPRLGEAQFASIARRYAKVNAEMREDFLQPDPARRQAESVKRTLDRAERLYGDLDAPQKRVVQAGVAASPFSPELWLQERARRQADTLRTLRRLQAERADGAQRSAALRALVQRIEKSPDPVYRAYQLKLTDYNCALAAQLHNATTPKQRRTARERLKGWEDDLRALNAGE